MLKSRCEQASFFGTDQVAEGLIPEGSFYRRFRELVWPVIRDDDFAALYCTANGRPAISPALLAMATILQHHQNLSDREMEAACQYDIRIKYALGLSIDERPFDHSSLGDFRDRLLRHGREKAVFDKILTSLIEQGLIAKDEPQRIDATHVIADIALPSMVTLVKKCVRGLLKPLSKHKGKYARLAKELDLAPYSKAKVNENHPGRPDEEKRVEALIGAVKDARRILEHVRDVDDAGVRHAAETLRRVLRENIKPGPKPLERDHKEKPKDLLVSPIDPDARFGAKSVTKHFVGYKANVTETVGSRFITTIKALPGNRPDGETMVSQIREQQAHRLIPTKVIGDTAYSDGSFRKALADHGVEVVAPLRGDNPKTRAVFPKSRFEHDAEKQTLTCPAGVTVRRFYYDSSMELHMFHFPMTQCGPCELRPRCTNAKERRRTVGISNFNKELRDAEIYNLTDDFKKTMRLRPPVEGKLAELVRYHGLRRARYRGLRKVQMQCSFTAAAVNVKRWVKLLSNRGSPPLRLAEAA
jgi:transposase